MKCQDNNSRHINDLCDFFLGTFQNVSISIQNSILYFIFFLFMCVFRQKLENIVVEGTGVNMSELTDIPNFTIAEALT